ncbi:MAG TPA: DUF1439 domain-containing protein [Bacteroidota bacterium]|nr:DUF1439 domain-containing protein [Bacteroidota bacterium]
MKRLSFLTSFFLSSIVTIGQLTAQNNLPLSITCRQSLVTRSYVLQIRNTSNDPEDLWLGAKGKITPFKLEGGKSIEFGWVQGYHFDANNKFQIWDQTNDTVSESMPDSELSPFRIGWSKDAGINVSFAKSFVNEQLTQHVKLPVQKALGKTLQVTIDRPPRVELREGSNRIYLSATITASVPSSTAQIPLTAAISCLPSYNQAAGEIGVADIRLENLDISQLPTEWFDPTKQLVNDLLPEVFSNFVLTKLKQDWLVKLAKDVNLRAKVIDGRLEAIIL